MLHRDVKSLNVFLAGPLDSQGRHTQLKLGDVGVSKVRSCGRWRGLPQVPQGSAARRFARTA